MAAKKKVEKAKDKNPKPKSPKTQKATTTPQAEPTQPAVQPAPQPVQPTPVAADTQTTIVGVKNGYNRRFTIVPPLAGRRLYLHGVRQSSTDFKVVQETANFTIIDMMIPPSITDKMEVRNV